MQVKIDRIGDKVDRMDDKFDKKFNMILDAVDNVLKEVTNNRVEKAAIDHALTRHKKQHTKDYETYSISTKGLNKKRRDSRSIFSTKASRPLSCLASPR